MSRFSTTYKKEGSMSNIMNRLTEGLAGQSSRRGFIGTMGKVVAALGAISIGEFFTAGQVLAASPDCPQGCCGPCVNCCWNPPSYCKTTAALCCTGHACPNNYCPSGTYGSYNWYCCYPGPHIAVVCYDCRFNCDHSYACTYTVENGYC